MRVLVCCEFSGIVRQAFINKGHEAWSCDLLDSEIKGPHFKEDVRELLSRDDDWDLVIAHPPCKYLSSSGLHWNNKIEGRQELTEQALEFVSFFFDYGFPKLCLENSIGCISTRIKKWDQIIHPYQFGHRESKSTCLWLHNLPLLVPTNIVSKPESGFWENQTPSGQNKVGESKNRWKNRSRTYQGIAEAMADQWGDRE